MMHAQSDSRQTQLNYYNVVGSDAYNLSRFSGDINLRFEGSVGHLKVVTNWLALFLLPIALAGCTGEQGSF